MDSSDRPPSAPDSPPAVVIIGGGFAGIAAAKALRHARARVVLIDKVNHSLFQPLLYQVAGSMLDAADIAFPIRTEFKGQRNATIAMAEVTGIDKDRSLVHIAARDKPLRYDYLVVASGVTTSYFGHDEWASVAPAMKTLADGIALRARILKALEEAELQEDPSGNPELTTFVIVGGGPTGCELAGTMAEMFRDTLRSEFRRVDPTRARILLVEAGPRILPSFSPGLSEKARRRLEKMGVEVLLGHAINHIDAEGVTIADTRIMTRNIIWAAGVTATRVNAFLGVETDRAGRIKVSPDLTVPGYPKIYAVGDAAYISSGGKPLPGVAPVALQSGRYAGRSIAGRLAGIASVPPFRYRDKGNLATIGRSYAVMEAGRLKLDGPIAKLAWAFIHIFYLMENEDRMVVFLKWIYAYFTKKRGARLIEEPWRCQDRETGAG